MQQNESFIFHLKMLSIHSVTPTRTTLIDMPFIFSSKKARKIIIQFIKHCACPPKNINVRQDTLQEGTIIGIWSIIILSIFCLLLLAQLTTKKLCEYFHDKANQLWNSTLQTTAMQFWQTVFSEFTLDSLKFLYKVNFWYNFKIIQLAHLVSRSAFLRAIFLFWLL